MEIVLFTNFFPYKKAEPFLVNEFEYTKAHNNSISVFTLYGNKKDIQIPSSPQINLFEPILESFNTKKSILFKGFFNFSPCGVHVKEFFKKGILFSPKKAYWYFVSLLMCRMALTSVAYKDLLKKMETSESLVLYFYWGDNLCWLIPYIKRSKHAAKCKIVLRLHGSDLYEELHSGYAPLREEIFSNTDLIVTVSDNGRNYLQQKYPVFKNKIKLSRLGVFDNGLNPYTSGDTFHIISVSNLVPLKRVDLIFECLQHSSVNIVWHHFGDGPLKDQLNERVKTAREGLKVVMHGFVDNKSLMVFYKTQSLDLFINLSTSEGLPVSIMEALSFGVPVFATNVGGTSELVKDNLGKLIDPAITPSQLGASIDAFLKGNRAELELMRKNARQAYDLKVSAEINYNAFYEELKRLFSGSTPS